MIDVAALMFRDASCGSDVASADVITPLAVTLKINL